MKQLEADQIKACINTLLQNKDFLQGLSNGTISAQQNCESLAESLLKAAESQNGMEDSNFTQENGILFLVSSFTQLLFSFLI